MNLRQQLSLRLSQNLVMTQSLQQAIKLLQLNKIELEQFIQKELEENPVLEEVAIETEPSEEERISAAREETTTAVDGEWDAAHDDVSFDYYFDDYIEYQHQRSVQEEVELPSFEATLATPTTLSDHLTWQLHLGTSDDLALAVGEVIIGNLDSDGYLQATAEEIASMVGCGVEEVEGVLAMVQQLDPVGVAARDLRECLLIQLEQIGAEAALAKRVVSDHLGDLERRAYDKIIQELGCSRADLQAALDIIRGLDPKPGSKCNSHKAVHVVPDVFIIRDGNEYHIVLNEEELPKLRISRHYKQLLARNSGAPEETRNFLRERLNSAKWLLKSFVQRQKTIYRVVESIVKQQREFFNRGIEHLRPMILSDVAYDIGMHESTVSRVVTNKYAHTPRGVYELKFFFSSGIRSANGEDVSSLAVKRRIKQIIEAEDSRKPLSDSKIMALLNKEGLKIARRTVAKYREEVRIPPSKLRKSVL